MHDVYALVGELYVENKVLKAVAMAEAAKRESEKQDVDDAT